MPVKPAKESAARTHTKPLPVASDRGGCLSDHKTSGMKSVDVGEVLPVGDEDVEVGEEEKVLEAEDVEPIKMLPTPVLPCPAEVEKHRVDHRPARSRCDECREGSGREKGHFKRPDDAPRSAIISFEYIVLKTCGGWGDFEDDVADGGIKILVVNESRAELYLRACCLRRVLTRNIMP